MNFEEKKANNNEAYVLYIRGEGDFWCGYFCGWRMAEECYFPVFVDSIDEIALSFKSNNKVKRYSSFNRALQGAVAVVSKSDYTAQIIGVSQLSKFKPYPFKDDVVNGKRYLIYDSEGKSIKQNK